MLLKKQEKEYKHALALLRESNKLYKQKWSVQPIKLDKPIQHGFKRTLEFREDVKKRPDYLKIKEVFDFLGQIPEYHPTEDFLVKIGKSTFEKHARIKTLTDPRYVFYWKEEKRKADLDKINGYKKYLSVHGSIYSCECVEHAITKWRKTFTPHYAFRSPWMLQEITKPHFLTHYTPLDIELESRLKKIHDEMESNNYYNIFFSRRDTWSKIWNERQLKLKYDDDVVYHTLNFEDDEY